jgi:hypothetical protein
VLVLVSDAIAIAGAQRWEVAPGLVLPDGPPGEAELNEIYLLNQLIQEVFFANEYDHGAQYETTWTVADLRDAELGAIDRYLGVHREAVLALKGHSERRSRLRAFRRVTGRLQAAWSVRCASHDDPF